VTEHFFQVKGNCMNPEEMARHNSPSGEKEKADSTAQPAKSPEPGEEPAASGLTKEEQWALFEKELKETDWGHQPC
jgi:hypothetical protein